MRCGPFDDLYNLHFLEELEARYKKDMFEDLEAVNDSFK